MFVAVPSIGFGTVSGTGLGTNWAAVPLARPVVAKLSMDVKLATAGLK